MIKFDRNYRMMVTGRSGNSIYLEYPLTLEFDVTSHIFAAGNKAEFSIYGLNKKNRDDLLIDQWLKIRDGYPIILNAGYRSQQPNGGAAVVGDSTYQTSPLPEIFNGFINVAYTERLGSELVTRIDAIDNGNVTSNSPSASFPSNFVIAANTPFVSVIKAMMGLLVNVRVGAVVVTPTPRPPVTRNWTPTGKVWDALQTMTPPGANVFIFNGVCHMLGENDVIPGANNVGTLNAETGLLNIPKYMGNSVVCQCVFEPALAIGKYVNLESEFSPSMTGRYKIIQFTHSGTISGAVSGTPATSTITLQKLPAPVQSTL